MRSALAYLTEIAGFGCLVYAAARISITAAFVVLGIGLILGAQAGKA